MLEVDEENMGKHPGPPMPVCFGCTVVLCSQQLELVRCAVVSSGDSGTNLRAVRGMTEKHANVPGDVEARRQHRRDSLVGVNFDPNRAFHLNAVKKGEQVERTSDAPREALDEAIGIRQQILELAADASPAAQRPKERLVADSEDAIRPVRLIVDLVVGAVFAETKYKGHKKARVRRLDILERRIGEQLYEAHAQYMFDTGQGLIKAAEGTAKRKTSAADGAKKSAEKKVSNKRTAPGGRGDLF